MKDPIMHECSRGWAVEVTRWLFARFSTLNCTSRTWDVTRMHCGPIVSLFFLSDQCKDTATCNKVGHFHSLMDY